MLAGAVWLRQNTTRKPDAVMHTTKTSDLLTGHSHTCGPSPATTNQSLQQLGATFRSRNILQGFSLAFPARSGY